MFARPHPLFHYRGSEDRSRKGWINQNQYASGSTAMADSPGAAAHGSISSSTLFKELENAVFWDKTLAREFLCSPVIVDFSRLLASPQDFHVGKISIDHVSIFV